MKSPASGYLGVALNCAVDVVGVEDDDFALHLHAVNGRGKGGDSQAERQDQCQQQGQELALYSFHWFTFPSLFFSLPGRFSMCRTGQPYHHYTNNRGFFQEHLGKLAQFFAGRAVQGDGRGDGAKTALPPGAGGLLRYLTAQLPVAAAVR